MTRERKKTTASKEQRDFSRSKRTSDSLHSNSPLSLPNTRDVSDPSNSCSVSRNRRTRESVRARACFPSPSSSEFGYSTSLSLFPARIRRRLACDTPRRGRIAYRWRTRTPRAFRARTESSGDEGRYLPTRTRIFPASFIHTHTMMMMSLQFKTRIGNPPLFFFSPPPRLRVLKGFFFFRFGTKRRCSAKKATTKARESARWYYIVLDPKDFFLERERRRRRRRRRRRKKRLFFCVAFLSHIFFALFFSSSCILLLSSLFWITSLSDPISPRISSEKKKTLSALCAGRERACARNPFSRRRERFFWTDDEKKTPTWNAF